MLKLLAVVVLLIWVFITARQRYPLKLDPVQPELIEFATALRETLNRGVY